MHRWLSHPWGRHLSRLHGSGLSVVCRSLQQRHRAYGTHWTVLGIETSCDDTAAAVVRRPRRCQPHGGDGTVLSNVVSSQHELTLSYGGVNPLAAYREHQERIDAVVQSALDKAAVSMQELDAIAVTSGPGSGGSGSTARVDWIRAQLNVRKVVETGRLPCRIGVLSRRRHRQGQAPGCPALSATLRHQSPGSML